MDQLQALQSRIETLEAELIARDQLLAHQEQRRAAAEAEAQANQERLLQLQKDREHSMAHIHSLDTELSAMEATLSERLQPPTQTESTSVLKNKRIVYVGGRPTSIRIIKTIVEAGGGQLLVHDGGIEDRKGLLTAALPKADMVVFPVDCIDHDSMSTLKRSCDRHQIPYHPLRTASAASFSALLGRLNARSIESSPCQNL